MAKYKLPKGFKIDRFEGSDSRLQIHDIDRNKFDICDSLKEAFKKIENYLTALEKIESNPLPNGYKIVTNGIDHKFILINSNDISVNGCDSFEFLYKEATKTTELDLQIAALNNGEEIEI